MLTIPSHVITTGPLLKWGFHDSSLVYVFVRRKEQEIIGNVTKESQKVDSSQGKLGLHIMWEARDMYKNTTQNVVL